MKVLVWWWRGEGRRWRKEGGRDGVDETMGEVVVAVIWWQWRLGCCRGRWKMGGERKREGEMKGRGKWVICF